MFAPNLWITMALLLTCGGALIAAPVRAASPAPLAPIAATAEDGVEPTTASLIADIHLPDGANRATNNADLAKFDQALREVAKTNHGTISRSEVLVWSGDAAKTVVSDISKRLKDSGYTVAETSTFDSEAGRVTPVAVMRGAKSDSIVGMWIVTKEGIALLVWGRFNPDAESAPATPVTAAKPTATPKKVAITAKPTKSTTTSKASSKPESAAVRQAKAMKAYQDYQYVKMMGPISGPMYRSSKW